MERPIAMPVCHPRSGVWAGLVALVALMPQAPALAASEPAADEYAAKIRPILEDACFACHGSGLKKGGVDLDRIGTDPANSHDRDLWWGVLRNVRAGFMPPADQPQPSAEEKRSLEEWIKSRALGIDPSDPDPGRVTVRRLNRVEYRNTIRDLLGVDFDTTAEFPPDDTGHGFDNIGDVLTLSPLLLEKYLTAANAIIGKVVPTVPRVVAQDVVPGSSFRRDGDNGKGGAGPLVLSYYEPATATATVPIEHEGRYRLSLEITANERYVDGVNDYNKCRLLFRVDGEELVRREFVRQDGKPFQFGFDRDWKPGPHLLTVEVQPLTPDATKVRSLAIRVQSATVRGPMDERFWVRPPDYERFFPREVPADAEGRRAYAREILGRFAARAFRRPVDDATRDRLAAFAGTVTEQGETFEAGVAQAMKAVLTSPRFLFREETAEPGATGRYAPIDEYDLASRLSYFLWSSMPDDELVRLAGEHKLRANLVPQVDRMLADGRSAEFFRNFVGQWLQARDIETVLINAQAVIARDETPDPDAEKRRNRFRALNRKPPGELTEAEKKEIQEVRASFGRGQNRARQFELSGDLRQAMRRETEMLFEHVVRGDRSLLEILDARYTFLNQRLATYYGIEGVQGDQMRKVDLPADSPRGGVLTQGTVLAVTSNPDRTSPVKRGLYILDNILGSPPAPPPPNIPSLEEAGKKVNGRTPTLRESMALHRSQPSCASCHARMDPLGLALENFNALGRFRDKERADPIDASGKLITGEPFGDVRDLKRILVANHGRDFYRCLTEKLLTYALGRGLDASDVGAVDAIVAKVEAGDGRASALIAGIIESAPFQKRRRTNPVNTAYSSDRGAERTSESTR